MCDGHRGPQPARSNSNANHLDVSSTPEAMSPIEWLMRSQHPGNCGNYEQLITSPARRLMLAGNVSEVWTRTSRAGKRPWQRLAASCAVEPLSGTQRCRTSQHMSREGTAHDRLHFPLMACSPCLATVWDGLSSCRTPEAGDKSSSKPWGHGEGPNWPRLRGDDFDIAS